jgi:hypothetical protein
MLAQTGQALGCFDSLQDAKLASLFIFHKEPIFKAVIGIYARQTILRQPSPDWIYADIRLASPTVIPMAATSRMMLE